MSGSHVGRSPAAGVAAGGRCVHRSPQELAAGTGQMGHTVPPASSDRSPPRQWVLVVSVLNVIASPGMPVARHACKCCLNVDYGEDGASYCHDPVMSGLWVLHYCSSWHYFRTIFLKEMNICGINMDWTGCLVQLEITTAPCDHLVSRRQAVSSTAVTRAGSCAPRTRARAFTCAAGCSSSGWAGSLHSGMATASPSSSYLRRWGGTLGERAADGGF